MRVVVHLQGLLDDVVKVSELVKSSYEVLYDTGTNPANVIGQVQETLTVMVPDIETDIDDDDGPEFFDDEWEADDDIDEI